MNCIDARLKVSAALNKLNMNFTPQIMNDMKEIANLFLEEGKNIKLKNKKKIFEQSIIKQYVNEQ